MVAEAAAVAVAAVVVTAAVVAAAAVVVTAAAVVVTAVSAAPMVPAPVVVAVVAAAAAAVMVVVAATEPRRVPATSYTEGPAGMIRLVNVRPRPHALAAAPQHAGEVARIGAQMKIPPPLVLVKHNSACVQELTRNAALSPR